MSYSFVPTLGVTGSHRWAGIGGAQFAEGVFTNVNKVHVVHSESVTVCLCPGYALLLDASNPRASSREKAALEGQ